MTIVLKNKHGIFFLSLAFFSILESMEQKIKKGSSAPAFTAKFSCSLDELSGCEMVELIQKIDRPFGNTAQFGPTIYNYKTAPFAQIAQRAEEYIEARENTRKENFPKALAHLKNACEPMNFTAYAGKTTPCMTTRTSHFMPALFLEALIKCNLQVASSTGGPLNFERAQFLLAKSKHFAGFYKELSIRIIEHLGTCLEQQDALHFFNNHVPEVVWADLHLSYAQYGKFKNSVQNYVKQRFKGFDIKIQKVALLRKFSGDKMICLVHVSGVNRFLKLSFGFTIDDLQDRNSFIKLLLRDYLVNVWHLPTKIIVSPEEMKSATKQLQLSPQEEAIAQNWRYIPKILACIKGSMVCRFSYIAEAQREGGKQITSINSPHEGNKITIEELVKIMNNKKIKNDLQTSKSNDKK